MIYINPLDLRERLRKGESAAPISKTFVGPNEPTTARQIKFTISTDQTDRDGDQIMQDGWQLANYLRNPVVLLNHKSDEMPIAKCVGIGVEGGDLKATVEFAPAGIPIIGQLAEAAYQLVLGGYLNATSVGFKPVEWDWDGDGDGIVFAEQELLEFSIVSVPSNPAALIEPASWFANDAPKDIAVLNTKNSLMKLRLRLLQLRI